MLAFYILFLQKHGTILKNWENEDIPSFPLFVEWLYTIVGFNELISFHFGMLYFLYEWIGARSNTFSESNPTSVLLLQFQQLYGTD
jgi:hypothetical protein